MRPRAVAALAWCATVVAPSPAGARAQPQPSAADRAAFRQAVRDYQIFVVAHCAPDQVHRYVAARAARDAAFVRSLRKAGLLADYRQAVADQAALDARTVFECQGPPPPPPPPPGFVAPLAAPPPEPVRGDGLAEQFTGGDRQFGVMAAIRDRVLHPPDR